MLSEIYEGGKASVANTLFIAANNTLHPTYAVLDLL